MKKHLKLPPVGTTYGRWTIRGLPGRNTAGFLVLEVACSCSPDVVVVRDAAGILRGASQSCGCLRTEASARAHRKHGQSSGERTRAYRIWRGMRNRCLNKRAASFKGYGGRGITITKRWDSFAAFYKDMGNPPSEQHTLGRKNNNGPYCKKNCAWQTPEEQRNNTRRSRFLNFAGQAKTLSQWARQYGLKPHTLRARLEAGWSVRRALTEAKRTWPARAT